MNKRTFDALGQVFSAEITGRLPFQSRAKIYRELCDDGLLHTMEKIITGPPFPVYVYGYALTHAGMYFYCANCRDVPEPEEP